MWRDFGLRRFVSGVVLSGGRLRYFGPSSPPLLDTLRFLPDLLESSLRPFFGIVA